MTSKIALAIKIATCLTHTQYIFPHYFRSRVALSEVVAARLREEEEGSTKRLSVESLPQYIPLSILIIDGRIAQREIVNELD
jgi:hypothetical protein